MERSRINFLTLKMLYLSLISAFMLKTFSVFRRTCISEVNGMTSISARMGSSLITADSSEFGSISVRRLFRSHIQSFDSRGCSCMCERRSTKKERKKKNDKKLREAKAKTARSEIRKWIQLTSSSGGIGTEKTFIDSGFVVQKKLRENASVRRCLLMLYWLYNVFQMLVQVLLIDVDQVEV